MAKDLSPPPDDRREGPEVAERAARWRRIILANLLFGYVGYYICRSNLSVVTPLLLDEFGPYGVTKTTIGAISSLGVGLYAIGKITNGLSADLLGGRRLFLIGAFGSVVCTVLFGLVPGMAMFAAFYVIWAANRYLQSMGWVGMVNVTSRWYPVAQHGTIMGILSMSYLAGDAFARWFLGQAIVSGASWRGVFFIAAATLGAIAIANLFMVRGKPSEVGLEEPDANPRSLYDEEPDEALPRLPMRRLLAPALTSFTFWLICTMNFGLTLVRETFNTWNPTYLNEMTGLDAGRAAIGSLLFPAVGAISALLAGLVTDRLSGRHGRVIVPCLIGLVVILVMLGLVDVDGRPTTALVLICGASFFLIAPYSFYSGVMALDLGGKRGAATIAGLSDSAGYAGGMVSGVGVGALAEHYSWAVAFLALAGVVFLTLCVAVVYWLRQERFEDERAAREGADVA